MLQVGERAPAFRAKPVFGYEVAIPDSARKRPLVLVFVPALESSISRSGLARLQERYADFDRLGVSVVAISPSSLRATQDFAPRYHVLFPLISDESGEISSRFDVGRIGAGGVLSNINPATIRGGVESLGLGFGLPNRGMLQAAAECVVDVDGTIAYSRQSEDLWETVDIDALLEAVKSCLS